MVRHGLGMMAWVGREGRNERKGLGREGKRELGREGGKRVEGWE